MSSSDEKRSFVDALVAYEEARLHNDSPTPVYDREALIAAGLDERFERAKQCVDLLASVYRDGRVGQDVSLPCGAAPTAPTVNVDRLDPPLGEFGPFRLLEVLGIGGMGTVYKAWHMQWNRLVAIKVVAARFAADTTIMGRFRREMAAGLAVKHPHLRDVLAAEEIDGKHVLVMDYIDGCDLAEVVRRLGPLAIADACEVVRIAAEALHHAHRKGIVHRDVKPCNLILGREGCVKVLDLGLAVLRKSLAHRFRRMGGSDITGAGQIVGTADFMAPEQTIDPHRVDRRTDVYALGCTLYYLLCGQSPFGGAEFDTPGKKMVAHVTKPLPPIANLRPELPKSLSVLLEQATAKNPSDRFATAATLAVGLTPLTSGCDLVGLAKRV